LGLLVPLLRCRCDTITRDCADPASHASVDAAGNALACAESLLEELSL
jgi:hypothetical protein